MNHKHGLSLGEENNRAPTVGTYDELLDAVKNGEDGVRMEIPSEESSHAADNDIYLEVCVSDGRGPAVSFYVNGRRVWREQFGEDSSPEALGHAVQYDLSGIAQYAPDRYDLR